jgi:dUTPase
LTPGDDPVAQIILNKITTPVVEEVPNLDITQQQGGFRSTNQTPITPPTQSFF